jgi:hypothetical protein
MKKLIIAAAIASASLANAECYMRSSTLAESDAKIEKIADIQNMFVKLKSGQMRCTSTFRVLIKGTWHDAEGQAIVQSDVAEAQACARAQNNGRVTLLQAVSKRSMTVQQEMVCTDQELPKTRNSVKIGDVVKESEVHPDPAWPETRKLRDGNVCRRFVESDLSGVDMRRSKGVICQVSENAWKVVDKY